jgi:hypothetical protein
MFSPTDNESTEMRIAFSPLVEMLPEWGRTLQACDRTPTIWNAVIVVVRYSPVPVARSG